MPTQNRVHGTQTPTSDLQEEDIALAVNLTPQYMEAEDAYKRAKTPEEKLEFLQKMGVLVPKHKASEKLQAQLKTKIRDAKDAVETKKTAKKGGVSYKVPRQGAGTYVLL